MYRPLFSGTRFSIPAVHRETMRLCRPESIRFRFTMMVGLLILVPLLVLGGLFLWESYRVEREMALTIELETADRVASEVKAVFLDKKNHLQQLIAIRGLTGLSRSRIQDLLFETLLYHNDYESLLLYDDNGRLLVRVDRGRSLNRPEVDAPGDRELCALVRKTGESHWGRIHFHPETGEPHIWLALPVFERKEQKLQFVLSADFRVRSLWGYFAGLKMKAGEEIFLDDAQGRIVAAADPSVVLRGEHYQVPLERKGFALDRHGRTAVTALSDFDLDRQRLVVVAQRATRSAFAPWYTLSLFMAVSTVVFLAAGLATSSLAVRRLVSPIEELAAVMQKVEEGDLQCRVAIAGENEIARLGRSFNAMLDKVQSLMNQMQARNDELRETRMILEWELRMNRIIARIENTLLNREPELREVAALTLEGCREVTESSMGYVSVVEPEHGREIMLASWRCGRPERQDREAADPAADEVARCCPHLHAICRDREQPIFVNGLDEKSLSVEMGVDNILCQPIRYRERLLGRIVLAASIRSYTGRDLAAVEQIGDIYGLAILRDENHAEQERLNRELRQAQKMEAIGTLAGGIAHDFNNILTAILGYCEIMVIELGEDHPLRENVSHIMQAGQRAARLVQQILTFSRREEGERKLVQIQYIIKEAVKMLRSSLPATIELKQDIDNHCPPILADATQVHQILMNLCTNAKDAMGERGGVLSISLQRCQVDREYPVAKESDLAPGEYLELRVQDTGTGIDPAIRDKIFEPFFTTKEQGKGTGLGLAVVHGIVRNHGATMLIEGEPGQGTVFRIFFPVARVSVSMARENSGKYPRGRGQHVMIVDDEEDIVQMLTRVVEHLGYRTTGYVGSRSALEGFCQNPADVDVLLTDMTMPEMNGVELATRILARRPGLPVVLCTGFSEYLDREKARLAGIGFFLQKPLSKDELGQALGAVLSMREEGASEPSGEKKNP